MTRGDLATYGLPSTVSLSPGLNTVGLGEPLYLEVQVDATIPTANIAGVIWNIVTQPSGSKATLVDSPLGTKVPVFEPADRQVYQVAGRKLLKPDVNGIYIVSATVTAGSSGTVTVAQTYIAATYTGIATCKQCHSGGLAKAMVEPWSKTPHAEIFTDCINGTTPGENESASCAICHTVGNDVNNTVSNGSFPSVMKQLNWTFPAASAQVAGTFAAMPSALQNVANIQCENCHGPGSEHASNGGAGMAISKPANTGACQRCHDAPTHHVKGTEWTKSAHAVTTREPAGNAGCVGCHTGTGFIQRMNGLSPIVSTAYDSIDCAACHESHGITNPTTAAHQIRSVQSVKLANGTVIDQGGTGLLCMNCHQSRRNATTYVATTAASSHYGPHSGTQADMLAGTNGYTYGQEIPSSAHIWAADETCVTCHMQATAPTDAAFLNAGGHTFKPAFTDTKGNKVELVGACQECHGKVVKSFNFRLFDYNNDGKIEGVQTEVQSLLDQLSTLLPPDNKVKSSLAIDATWTKQQLAASYNWSFVNSDGSKGVHNTAYAVGLLKASIADLTKK